MRYALALVAVSVMLLGFTAADDPHITDECDPSAPPPTAEWDLCSVEFQGVWEPFVDEQGEDDYRLSAIEVSFELAGDMETRSRTTQWIVSWQNGGCDEEVGVGDDLDRPRPVVHFARDCPGDDDAFVLLEDIATMSGRTITVEMDLDGEFAPYADMIRDADALASPRAISRTFVSTSLTNATTDEPADEAGPGRDFVIGEDKPNE